MFDITLADGVLYSLIVVAVAIVIDTLLGAIKAAKDDYDSLIFGSCPNSWRPAYCLMSGA